MKKNTNVIIGLLVIVISIVAILAILRKLENCDLSKVSWLQCIVSDVEKFEPPPPPDVMLDPEGEPGPGTVHTPPAELANYLRFRYALANVTTDQAESLRNGSISIDSLASSYCIYSVNESAAEFDLDITGSTAEIETFINAPPTECSATNDWVARSTFLVIGNIAPESDTDIGGGSSVTLVQGGFNMRGYELNIGDPKYYFNFYYNPISPTTISGTFEFLAVNPSSSDVLVVYDGEYKMDP